MMPKLDILIAWLGGEPWVKNDQFDAKEGCSVGRLTVSQSEVSLQLRKENYIIYLMAGQLGVRKNHGGPCWRMPTLSTIPMSSHPSVWMQARYRMRVPTSLNISDGANHDTLF